MTATSSGGKRCGASDACPLRAQCAPARPPCREVTAAHATILALCARLEEFADNLPHADAMAALKVANDLLPTLRRSHAYEESTIFPALGSCVPVARFMAEHLEDECAAEEATEALFHIGHGGEFPDPEALGFMLRALFGALRRHVAGERDWLPRGLPLSVEC